MKNKYQIRMWQDNIYAIYENDNPYGEYFFKGTIEEVNAWLSLKEKGFNL